MKCEYVYDDCSNDATKPIRYRDISGKNMITTKNLCSHHETEMFKRYGIIY